MDITQAKVVSSVIIYLVIWLLLLLNVINAVKCQISVSKVVDPPMPWGDDEHFGIRLIRLSCFVFTTAFVALTYALGVYSLLYYVLIQRDASEKVPTESTFIYFGFILFLVITGTITGLIAKFYEPVNEQHSESIIPRQMNRFVWILPASGTVFIILAVIFENVHQMFGLVHSWQIIFLIISIVTTITPALLIYREDKVKSYASRILKNKMEEAFLLSIYITPAMVTIIMYGTLYIIYELLDM